MRHTPTVSDSSTKTGKGKQNELEKNAVVLQPKLILASDVKQQAMRWLWENKILRGALSLITGLSGMTKTFWTVYMARCITNGRDWADGSPCELGSVLFFYGEEGIADLYMERLEANGVDRSKCAIWLWAVLTEGEKPVNQIYELGKAQGYSERTIDRAKSELEVGSRRVGFGKEGHIVWNLPCSVEC